MGKSNISVNLSIALSQQGERVCLFDADINLANTNILLGLTPALTLHDFLRERLDISEILTPGPEGIQIVPAATGIADFTHLDRPQQTHMLSALQGLEKDFDYLLIDTAAGVDETLINFLLAAPYTIIAITPEPTSLTDAFSLLKTLKKYDFNQLVYVIVNMVDSRAVAHDAFKRFNGAVSKYLGLKPRYLGYIPNDNKLSESVRNQQAVLLRHLAAQASRCILDITYRLRQLLDASTESGGSGFSAYFDALVGPDLPLQMEECAGGKIDDGPESVWSVRKALECLQRIGPDEAVRLLAEVILNWDEENSATFLALQRFLLDCTMSPSQQEEQRLGMDQLLQHTIKDVGGEAGMAVAVAESPLDPQPVNAEDNKRVFDLVMRFGTSQSPKRTRSSTTCYCPGRPGHWHCATTSQARCRS
ncbi:MAG: MinD/ParA family protein, partial [Gammaproteobacteria bacterium]|nr:MinD/ParA family protein [Gammaproteobacteria bacterium]